MSGAGVKVTLFQTRLKALDQAAVRALEKTGEALHTEVVQAQVVPRDQGTLQGEAFTVDYSQAARGEVDLVHSTPYARRLYYHPEYKFQKTENPHAKGKWFEDWLPEGSRKDFALQAFKEIYKEEAGNAIK